MRACALFYSGGGVAELASKFFPKGSSLQKAKLKDDVRGLNKVWNGLHKRSKR
jgi:hypothetical protein